MAYLPQGAWSRTRGVSLGSRVRGLGSTNASRPVRAGNHNEVDRQNYQGGGVPSYRTCQPTKHYAAAHPLEREKLVTGDDLSSG